MLEQSIIDQYLGHQATDKVAGMKGLVTALHEHITGTVQASVQPKSPKGDTMPDAWMIDIAQLDITIDPKVSVHPPHTFGAPPCNLGDQIEDQVTKISGICTVINYYLNGCIACAIEKADKDGKIKLNNINAIRVVVKKKAAFKAPVPPPAKKPTSKKPGPGGPPMRAF